MACDRSTKEMTNFQWAHMLIRVNGQKLPSFLEVKMAGWIWKVQLWWENILVLTEKAGKFSSPAERREEGEVVPRVRDRMKKMAVGTTVKVLQKNMGGSIVEESSIPSKWTTLIFDGSMNQAEEAGLEVDGSAGRVVTVGQEDPKEMEVDLVV